MNGSAKIASDQAKKILDAAAGSKQDDAKAALKELQSTLVGRCKLDPSLKAP